MTQSEKELATQDAEFEMMKHSNFDMHPVAVGPSVAEMNGARHVIPSDNRTGTNTDDRIPEEVWYAQQEAYWNSALGYD